MIIPKFEELKDDYKQKWEGMYFPNKTQYNETENIIKNQLKYKEKYITIQNKINVPWWFSMSLHILESGGIFNTHLHNGDSLSKPTYNIPRNRPSPKWKSPPGTWEDSAIDALSMKEYDKVTDWSIEHCLYLSEKYNGFKTRLIQKTNSPYLWSYTNWYTKGKYVRDGIWNPNTVSKQPGVAILYYLLKK